MYFGVLRSFSPVRRWWNTAPVTDGIRVLYVEDDERLARLTMEYLVTHGLEVHLVPRGDLAVADVMRIRPDVVLLDVMLPGADGFEVCRQLRARTDVPIIMVTARLDEAERVRGLEGGADDYVTKPFQSRELLARIRAQARRSRGEVGPRPDRLRVGSLVIEPSSMSVTVRGEPVVLTANEFALVHALAQRPGRVLDREQLLQLLHGTPDEAFDRSIDVVVSRVRAKIELDPKNPRMLKTVRGVGYMLAAGES
jgi:two-component system OmpR family response regulator